jgi:hypothetical protein
MSGSQRPAPGLEAAQLVGLGVAPEDAGMLSGLTDAAVAQHSALANSLYLIAADRLGDGLQVLMDPELAPDGPNDPGRSTEWAVKVVMVSRMAGALGLSLMPQEGPDRG